MYRRQALQALDLGPPEQDEVFDECVYNPMG